MIIQQRLSFLLPILLSISLLPSCHDRQKQPAQAALAQKPVAVNAIVVTPKTIENKIYSTGNILANEEVEIRAEVPGRITSINFQEGTDVRKGELLVKINDSELQAELKKLMLDEKLAEDDVYRKEKLLELKAISQEELDISLNQLGVIQAQIELLKARIEKASIYAPFHGKIGLRYVSPGGYISSSMLIARMQQIDPVKIEFNVPEKYNTDIRKDMEIMFEVAGSDSIFTAHVYAIDPRIDPSTRTFTVRARCANPSGLLKPGAFSNVSIILEKLTDALVLPSDALIPDIKGEKVLLSRKGKVETVYVHIGIRTDSDVQITDGISINDTVIVSGLLQLRDQMSVQPRITGNSEAIN
jgi:membrane fusion protein (multidrug efflux system)